jgi:hypothetical protein
LRLDQRALHLTGVLLNDRERTVIRCFGETCSRKIVRARPVKAAKEAV